MDSNKPPQDKLLKVGELADVVGKTVRALHLYEEKGLLQPDQRSGGGYRLYSTDAVERVQWIDRLQHLGFSLTEIQQFLDGWRGANTAPEAMARVREIFTTKLDETRATLVSLHKLELDLKESLGYLEGCTSCAPSHKQHQCGTCDQNGHDPKHVPVLVVGLTKNERVH